MEGAPRFQFCPAGFGAESIKFGPEGDTRRKGRILPPSGVHWAGASSLGPAQTSSRERGALLVQQAPTTLFGEAPKGRAETRPVEGVDLGEVVAAADPD
jgi:hypothetical protein